MSRRYDDPVEVRRRDDEPAEFLWRDRLWVVRAVLARWVETGAWWQAALPTGNRGIAGSSAGSSAGGSALACESVLALDSAALSVERELWRVEATRGRVHGMGVFDLCFDWAATAGTGWTLARALD
jgi:predicted transcriptional regulator